MSGRDFDIAIVGGGLSGGLIALALDKLRPDISVKVLEAGPRLGGNHRWSWFASDLDDAATALFDGLRKSRWDRGYDVCFPGWSRHLFTAYSSLASTDFAAGIKRHLPEGTVRTGVHVDAVDRDGVSLATGERITAGAVIDCRGFQPTQHLTGGWQVFMGRLIRTSAPHGIESPVIMDADVEQLGGYRFIYVLPLSPDEIFVEDTYYQNTPDLDRAALSGRIGAYCELQGWGGETLGEETGVLPVITGGDFSAFQADQRIDGVAVAGARGGFTHPLTSYTLPFAAATALAIAREPNLTGDSLSAMLENRARQHWSDTAFYRRLGAMLFGAAEAEDRWQVFDRFYKLDRKLVERFYAARSTKADKARILCGKPPVPIGGAMRSMIASQSRLTGAA